MFNTKCIFHAINNPQRFSVIGSKLCSIKGNPKHVGAIRHFNNQLVKKLGKLSKNKVLTEEHLALGISSLTNEESFDESDNTSTDYVNA